MKSSKLKDAKSHPFRGLESLEARQMLAADLGIATLVDAGHGPGGSPLVVAADVAHFDGDGHDHGDYGLDYVPLDQWKGEFYTPPAGEDHDDNPLTIILDFNDPGQPNTTDGIGNVVSTFDVTAYGFSSGDFNTVANAVLTQVRAHYNIVTNNVDSRSPILEGYDLDIEFEIGNIGTPPSNGSNDFYYLQLGSDVNGGGPLGQAGLDTIRNSAGVPGVAVGSVVGTSFTDNIQGLSNLTPANALSSGNLAFTVDAIAGTTSHEIGHALSLLHLNKAGSVTPSGIPPLMGTGAIDLPAQDRINDREFAFSGINDQNGGATQRHIDQLVGALGTHDTRDANDQISEAFVLSVPGTTGSGFTIEATTDVDVFQISASAGQRIGFDIDSAVSDLDPLVRLFDSSGNFLASDDDGTGPAPEIRSLDSYLEYVFPTSGTYYLGVSDLSNSSYNIVTGNGDSSGDTGAYTLITTDLGVDNNGTLANALPVQIGVVRPSGSIAPAVDVDMHSFNVAANQRVQFDVNVLSGNLDSRLRLFDSSGTEIAQDNVGLDSFIDFTFPTAGTYFAGVTGSGTNSNYNPVTGAAFNDNVTETGTYDLLLIDPDPNDQISEASNFSIPGTTGIFTLDSTADVDILEYTVSAGQTIGFDVDNEAGSSADVEIRLFDAAGNQLAVDDDTNGPAPEVSGVESYLEFTFTTAGNYYLAAAHFSNNDYDPLTGAGDSASSSTSIGDFRITATDLTPTNILVTESGESGDGLIFNGVTLREAVNLANVTPGTNTINFDAAGVFSSPQTIVMNGSQYLLSDDVTINGPGANQLTLNANAASRHFEIASGVAADISDMELTNGNGNGTVGGSILSQGSLVLEDALLNNNESPLFGGGLRLEGPATIRRTMISDNLAFRGGAVGSDLDGATATFVDVTFANNTTTDGSGGGGGGVYAFGGDFVFINSSFEGNQALNDGDGGGLFVDANATATLDGTNVLFNEAQVGGGIANIGSIDIMGSRIEGNIGTGDGGGLFTSETATVDSSLFLANESPKGGAIAVNGGSGSLTLTESTISGNTAGSQGGGIFSFYGSAINVERSIIASNNASSGGGILIINADLTVDTSTISGNSATADGGGIDMNGGPLNVNNSTIAFNTAGSDGGGLRARAGAATFTNSIVGDNTAVGFGPDIDDFGGGSVTASFSLISNTSSVSIAGANNVLNQDPALGPLANNGGTTTTHLLLPGSPAINAGDPAFAGAAIDQRGQSRVIGGVLDIGAVEVNPPAVRDLGGVPGGASTQPAYELRETEVAFYRFDLNADVLAANGSSLTIDTAGTALDSNNDTELGLYDDQGNLVALDDDGLGVGFLSQLSFGDGGVHGDLAAGGYYLAIAGFDTTFGVANFDAISTSDDNGSLVVNFSLTPSVVVDGDFNNDGAYDCDDVDTLVANIAGSTNDPLFDLTGDTLVDTDDLTAWLAEAGAVNNVSGNPHLPGDANLDGFVDISDFNVWNGNKFTSVAAWCSGDFTADGFVDISDFNVWNSNKFTASDTSAAIFVNNNFDSGVATAIKNAAAGGLTAVEEARAAAFVDVGDGQIAAKLNVPAFDQVSVRSTDSDADQNERDEARVIDQLFADWSLLS